MEQIKEVKIIGILNYITPYKKLVIRLTEKEAADIKKELDALKGDDNEYRIPLKLSNDGFLYLTVALSKYDKPKIENFEKIVKKRMTVTAVLYQYASNQFGKGACLRLKRYTIV